MKQSNVIKGTLAVVALVAALVVGVAVHMHSVGSPTAGHSTQNTAKTATETTAKTAESITADYPGYSSAEEGVKAAGLVVTGVPLDSRERILYPEIDFTSGTPETNPQYGLTEDDIDMDALGVPETVTRVRVTKVIKGDAKVGDIIEVAQVGGRSQPRLPQGGGAAVRRPLEIRTHQVRSVPAHRKGRLRDRQLPL